MKYLSLINVSFHVFPFFNQKKPFRALFFYKSFLSFNLFNQEVAESCRVNTFLNFSFPLRISIFVCVISFSSACISFIICEFSLEFYNLQRFLLLLLLRERKLESYPTEIEKLFKDYDLISMNCTKENIIFFEKGFEPRNLLFFFY